MQTAVEARPDASRATSNIDVLITASEAYPKFEALMLGATNNIVMGFRIFDPETRLVSEKARAVGSIWADLLVHTLNRGVPVTLILSDFDPIVGHTLHEMAWRSVEALEALNDRTKPDAAQITVNCFQHPAEGGFASRLIFALKTRKKLREIAREITESDHPEERLHYAPGLSDLLFIKGGKVRMRKTALPAPRPVTLHHKMAIFDDEITYIGGLDLNDRRYDDLEHDRGAQETWHDVQMVSHDPQVAMAAQEYLRTLPDVTHRKAPPARHASPLRVTLSRKRASNFWHLAPERVLTQLLDEYLKQIARARTFIYIETQYFRDRRISKALARAAQRNAGLRLIVLLPAAPEEALIDESPGIDTKFGEYLQARALRRVRRAFGNRFLAVSPIQPRRPDARDASHDRATLEGSPVVYVHSKLAIFDDHAAIISSANINGRSMKWDAEAGVVLDTPEEVRFLTSRVFEIWLGEDKDCTPQTAFTCWVNRALRNAGRAPEDREGFIVPYDLKAATLAGVPVPGAPEELV